jgi:hypothetical protein
VTISLVTGVTGTCGFTSLTGVSLLRLLLRHVGGALRITSYVFSSSNASAVAVDERGMVHALELGHAVITVEVRGVIGAPQRRRRD